MVVVVAAAAAALLQLVVAAVVAVVPIAVVVIVAMIMMTMIILLSYSKNAIGVKKASKKKGHFAHIGNEIKICSQNKCHHHLSNVCENSFRMFHSNWVISDYHSFVWQFVRFSQGKF